MSKKIKITIAIISVIAVYAFVYYITLNKYEKKYVGEEETEVNSTTIENDDNVDTKEIVFQNMYLKSQDVLVVHKDIQDKVYKMDEDELNIYFKDEDYKVKSIDDGKIILEKDIDNYSPNKYYISIDGEYLGIFKTDDNNKSILVETTDVRIAFLKEGDISSLREGRGAYQFDSLEEAKGCLEDYI